MYNTEGDKWIILFRDRKYCIIFVALIPLLVTWNDYLPGSCYKLFSVQSSYIFCQMSKINLVLGFIKSQVGNWMWKGFTAAPLFLLLLRDTPVCRNSNISSTMLLNLDDRVNVFPIEQQSASHQLQTSMLLSKLQ